MSGIYYPQLAKNAKLYYTKAKLNFMETQNNPQQSKHMRSFWPLIIIFTVAALLGGVIIGVSYSNELQDELSALTFMPHRDFKNATSTEASTKAKVKGAAIYKTTQKPQ
jgi:hypothetical protein